jgi:beta-lactamase regulating signal transducer with metallopeptidase domain
VSVADPVRLLLTNAAAAGLIALVAWAASRVVRRPAVVHGLWLLALVRLVTPPIAPLPLLPAWTGLPLVSAPPSPTVVAIASPRAHAPSHRPPASLDVATARPLPPVGPRQAAPAFDWRVAGRTLLGSGALAIVLLAAWRFTRFGRLLAWARLAPPSVADRASTLAARLGLRSAPPVLLLPARVPPMLWPTRGGPQLLLPESLLAELRGDELDALLAHELAHVRRRDHWVRVLEIAATALFWWYPVTWWARRALRRAEERCCDEWVLRLLPRSAEAYANGLLKSLTFVAASPLPAVASGLGPVDDLEARLKEILMTRPVPQLAAPLRFALAAAATLGLAVFPTHAQSTAASGAETPAPAAPPAPAPKPAAAPLRARPTAPTAPPAVGGGVLAIPETPPPALPVAGGGSPRDPERRALEGRRRALEEQRQLLQQQELEIQRQQLELEAEAEQAELRAEAERLRADGRAEEAARVDRRLELAGRRTELLRRRLRLQGEQMALEAKLEADARAREEKIEGAQRRVEHELQARQQALEREMAESEDQMKELVAEDQVRHVHEATEELARSVAEQIESLERAAADAPARKLDLEREIERLKAALDALEAGETAGAPRP